MLSFSEAQEILKANIPKPKVVRLPLSKAADYCLAADVKGDVGDAGFCLVLIGVMLDASDLLAMELLRPVAFLTGIP